MPGPGFALYGNPSALTGLADSQRTYEAKFQGIMAQLADVAGVALKNWSGGGHSNFDGSHNKLSGEYDQVCAAFKKMASMTDDAGSKWTKMISFANSRF